MKTDLKREADYKAKTEPALVEVPARRYLMVDGRGDPNTAEGYADALGALYSTAYKAKFAAKAVGQDFVVPPLEGLWWADDMDAFLDGDRDAWQWTMMIAIPSGVDDGLVREAVSAANESGSVLRMEVYEEGSAAQVLHVGPYSAEAPTIERLHRFIDEQGLQRRGFHHEIYLGDPRRTDPEKLKTIIRQPVSG